VRQLGDETILVANHLSNAAPAVELDLRRVNIRIEMFGKNIFPRVGEVPYLLTLGPYHFYWFRLPRI
jgi:maltose alpha-D-glucosyltransferase/alpha-amylase